VACSINTDKTDEEELSGSATGSDNESVFWMY